MLNGDLKEQAISRLEKAQQTYETLAKAIKAKSERLMTLRQKDSVEIISNAEELFSRVANKPKTFDKSFEKFKADYKEYQSILHDVYQSSQQANTIAGSSTGAGMAAGIGVVAFAPTAAMAVATTFGTASTGVAISSLSGAAATNAALAWLGGGALAAGGGGMAAGNALLALAGPVGWAIGGVALAGSAIYLTNKNKEIAKEANRHTQTLIAENSKLKVAQHELDTLIKETREHISGLDRQLTTLKASLKNFDYTQMNSTQKQLMIAIKNHIESLSLLIKKRILLN